MRKLIVTLLAVWLLAWIVIGWGACQDDALIHLRYAEYLHRVGFITYDGVRPSFGTSSLLYVHLLAALRSVSGSPLLPHAVSAIFHVTLFLLATLWVLRARWSEGSSGPTIALVLLAVLVAPSAVRWLEDGMETSLVLLLVGLVIFDAYRMSLRQRSNTAEFLAAMLLGFLLVLLRIELALVAVFASSILILSDAGGGVSTDESGWLKRAVKALPGRSHFVVGAVIAAAAIRLRMGSLLPDTALAKSDGIRAFFPTLINGAHVIGGALFFGVGSLAVWIASAIIVLRLPLTRKLPTWLANAMFPLLLFMAAIRGQKIQGARYLLWAIFFSICWNLLELHRAEQQGSLESAQQTTTSGITRQRQIAVACVAICLIAIAVDSRFSYRTLRTRVHTMRAFTSEDLAAALPNALGVAGDVGFISYFTQDPICDIDGLINGRAAAALTPEQRVARCAAAQPDFAFVNNGQLRSLAEHIDFTQWRVCGTYDLGNTDGPDRHFLLVRARIAEPVCRASAFTPQPVPLTFSNNHY